MSVLTRDQITQYAQNAGFSGSALATIVAIAFAESGGNTQATNSVGNSAGVDRGLVQINSYYHSEVPDSCAFDPACAMREAYSISQNGSNFATWATFTGGEYKQYLTGSGTSVASTATSTTTDASSWLSNIQPFFTWITNPVRVMKLVSGIVLVLLAFALLVAPEATKQLAKHPEVLLGA